MYGFTYFPEELGLKNYIPKFSIHTTMTEEEYRNAVYTTRQRKRYFECGFSLIALIVAIFLGILRKNPIAFVAIICFIIYKYILKPLKFTKNHIAKMKDKYGTAEFDTYTFLLDNEIINYSPIDSCVYITFYQNYTYLYLKKDYLFICNDQALGQYIGYNNMQNRDELIEFLKNKCPGISVSKWY